MSPYFNYPYTYSGAGGANFPDMKNIPQIPPSPAAPMMPLMPMCPQPPCMQMYPGMGHMVDGTGYMWNPESSLPMSTATGDPPPVLSNNPAALEISLFKDLTGYPNYGNPSGNADILYTRTRGVWTFDVPVFLVQTGITPRARLMIRAVLDDHYNVPVERYSCRITVNETVVHNGPVPLEHGTPAGSRFVNWRNLTFNVPSIRRTTRVVIENTSSAGPDDWIGIDWMELRFRTGI